MLLGSDFFGLKFNSLNLFPICCKDPMIDIDIQELANLTAGDADVENFERLFTKLKEMKGIGTLCST